MNVFSTFMYITRYIKISVRSLDTINGDQRWRGRARLLIYRGYNMPNKNPILNLANTQTHTKYNFRCYYNNFNLCFATSLLFLKYETHANIYSNITYYLVLTLLRALLPLHFSYMTSAGTSNVFLSKIKLLLYIYFFIEYTTYLKYA